MNINKQSSVEWLFEEIFNYIDKPWKYDKHIILLKAKAMHKEEIEKLEQEIKFLKTYIKMYETK